MSTRLLKAPEVAQIINASIPRTYELLRQGMIPAVRLGQRQIRVSEQVLLDWIKQGGSVQSCQEQTEGEE